MVGNTMEKKIINYCLKNLLIIAIFIVSLASVSAITVNQLVNSYDYDFSDGTIRVIQFTDYMVDQDSNGVNDTLVFNLTTNASGSIAYFFVVKLDEDNGLVQNYTNVTVNASDPVAQVRFDTRMLQKSQYNYSVEIREQDFSLAYAKYGVETSNYSVYERGISILSLADQTSGTNLRINVTFNVTQNITANVTVHLAYDDRIISMKKSVTLTSPITVVNVDFDNETVKSTHYSGTYRIQSVVVNEKLLTVNFTTASYDYENFAQTSYIRNISSGVFDNNSNGIYDGLQFNITVIIKNSGTYNISAPLYDSNDNYIVTLNSTQALGVGTHVLVLNVSGPIIYANYHEGRFLLPVVTMVNASIIDIYYDAHTTGSYSYESFEPPELPDLTLSMSTSLDNGTTNVTLTLTNQGYASAFNILVKIFDNGTYDNQTSVVLLSPSQSYLLDYSIPNTSAASIIVGIADFGDTVDEMNETNNFVSSAQPSDGSLSIDDLSVVLSNTTVVIGAVITNNGTVNLSDVRWEMIINDGTAVNATMNLSLTQQESAVVFFENSYDLEERTATMNVSDGAVSIRRSITFGEGRLRIINATSPTSHNLTRIIAFTLQNGENTSLTDIGWTINTGESILRSTMYTNLSTQENATYVVEYVYTTPSIYAVNIIANNTEHTASTILTVFVTELGINDLVKLASNTTLAVFKFDIENQWGSNRTATWSFDTNDTGAINATSALIITPAENVSIFIQNNFTTTGNYSVQARANTSAATYVRDLDVTI